LDALETRALPSDVLVVIVPRHPQRFAEVGQLLSSRKLPWAARSGLKNLTPDCRFLLGDSLGEMPAYYAAADVAFIGGSLLAFGGQNLIEACAAGVPVLFGPYTYNFSDAARAALEEGAAKLVINADALVHSVADLLADDATRMAMGRSGQAFCERHRGAAQRIGSMVQELLDH
jgi:3-deoxy-D-manno-octulosonic-acid transferase